MNNYSQNQDLLDLPFHKMILALSSLLTMAFVFFLYVAPLLIKFIQG